MEKQPFGGFIFADKPVYDWNRFPLGTIADCRRDPKTNAARQLIVTLSAEAKAQLGTKDDLMTVPVSLVFGIRKDAVSLDRSVDELRRIEEITAHVLKR